MPTIIPPGFAQCAWHLALAGDPEPIVITFGVSVDTLPVTQAIVNDLHLGLKTGAGLLAQISSSYTSLKAVMYVGQDGGPPVVWESNNSTQVGGGAGAPLPQNNAVLITKRTASAGRRNKGRLYCPGIGEGAVDAVGTIAGATVTAFQTAADAWLTAINATTGIGGMVILHTSGGVTTPPAPTPVTALVVQPKIATQRRRLRP